MLSLTDNHVIDAWVYTPPETFYPYSLLSGTTIRTTNRTLFLFFLWFSTKPYLMLHPEPSGVSRPETTSPCSQMRKLRRIPQGDVDLYRALAASVLRVIRRLCTKGGSRSRKNCICTECLDCESSRKEQSPALVYAIDGTRA